MKLVFQQQIIELDNKVTAEETIEKINGLLETGYYFSHFIADGKEVYENHESYLNVHINTINQLEIIVKTMKEFTNDILLSAEGYVERALPELSSVSNEFYNNPTAEIWERFEQMLEGLQWLNGMMEAIGQIKEKPGNWAEYEEIASALQEELVNLEEAVENEDHVLIGDMIQYEILPNFEALKSATQTTIDNEGRRPNLN